MYDKTYLKVKKLIVEFYRFKYQHVDEKDIYDKTNEILESLSELEKMLKLKIEGES
tara:strand:- start:315 stop:482 length:168 start_codon:yes stop_codon:yes gene_type:complete